MRDKNEILWIKGKTKERLFEIKGRKTFDNLINDLLDNTQNELKKKPKKLFPHI